MNQSLGTLYLIPNFLSEQNRTVIPEGTINAIKEVKTFFVESEKQTNRLLAWTKNKDVIDAAEYVFVKELKDRDLATILFEKSANGPMGVVSDAGCPAIADPGAKIVLAAHEMNFKVVPLSGPSSIFMALMASGFNGQQFQFNGYLPIDSTERQKSIRKMEAAAQNGAQIFMETPYRNEKLFEDLLKLCGKNTLLSIASNLTSDSEFTATKSIGEWKNHSKPSIHKQPTIFILSA